MVFTHQRLRNPKKKPPSQTHHCFLSCGHSTGGGNNADILHRYRLRKNKQLNKLTVEAPNATSLRVNCSCFYG